MAVGNVAAVQVLLAAGWLGALPGAARAQDAHFNCSEPSVPAGAMCWCRDTYNTSAVVLNSDLYYRTAFNRVTRVNQTLLLDEWLAPSRTPRPGALIIHGGGYSAGPYNGCSHAKNMTSFAAVAMALARRGFAVVSIDYRCEGALRRSPIGDNFHPWYDAVEDARAAVRYMTANAERLMLDVSRIVAFGGSAGANAVAQLLHAVPDNAPMPPPRPPAPPPADNCTRALEKGCPLPFAGGNNHSACLACARAHAQAPVCKPWRRVAYCNGTRPRPGHGGDGRPRKGLGGGPAGGNVTCGIGLSGAITPGSIASGEVTASPASPPYLDFHGTNDSTVPYDYALAKGDNTTWGDAVDTKAWLDHGHAPNHLASIPGPGHVPFGAIPPCDPSASGAAIGCWSSTFFGFLVEAMELAAATCPVP